VNKRRVHNQRDADGDVEGAESIEQEEARPRRRGGEVIKRNQEENQPEDGVGRLDGELGRREQQREERDVARHGQGPEGAEIPAVLQGDEAEGDDDEEDGLLMDMPPEEERGVSAEGDSPDEVVPGGLDEQLEQGNGLEEERENEAHPGADIR